MNQLNTEETMLLRFILGLNPANRTTPLRNHSTGIESIGFKHVLADMKTRGLLDQKFVIGPGGREYYYLATPDGINAVLQQPWQ